MSASRTYDVVVWGATGFTGRLVAEYLASAPSARSLRWAVAARNREKLDGVAQALGLDDSVGRIIANADDSASLAELARQTKVVCTTVGPYTKYGSKLVAACVAEGTHYCDLAGETPWIRDMIDAHHEAAAASGTRIVHCCGFDSIPSDLGVLMMHAAMRERGLNLGSVDALAGESSGTFSGGTVASLLGVLDRAKSDRDTRRMLGNPYGLNPADAQTGPDQPDAKGIGYERRLGTWTAPFVMAAINTRIVRRSNALTDFRYGTDFRYSERHSLGGGAGGLARATGLTGALGGFMVAAGTSALRPWLEKKLPAPGEGPSKEQRDNGFFVMRHIAESAESPNGEPTRLIGKVAHDRDPGYGSTAVMLAESAMCLATDDLDSPGGVLTPASAMGERLITRLRAAGMTFEVSEG